MITIYKITNSVNDKIYIGQTKKPINVRFSGHISDSKRSKTKLSNAIRKHGCDKFNIEEIVKGDFNREFADHLESHYIQLYASFLQYNIKKGGNSVEMTDETKKKISENNKGMKMPPRLNYKDADRYSADKLDEVRAKRSLSHMGGKNHNAKKVIDNLNGVVYDCISDAANSFGMHWKTLSRKLNNKTKNNTPLRWFDGTDLKIRIGGVTKTFTVT
jgi:group I intron endonuclease